MTYPIAICLGLIGAFLVTQSSRDPGAAHAQTAERPRLTVTPAQDFEVTGRGDHAAWQKVEWTTLRRRQSEGHPYDTRFKMLYSNTGLYFLMEGTDRKVTATTHQAFI